MIDVASNTNTDDKVKNVIRCRTRIEAMGLHRRVFSPQPERREQTIAAIRIPDRVLQLATTASAWIRSPECISLWAPRFSSILCTLVIAALLVRLVVTLTTPIPLRWNAPTISSAMPAKSYSDIEPIRAVHLFGEAASAPLAEEPAQPIIESSVAAELRAIVTSADATFAHVILDADGEQLVLFPGDTLPDGRILDRVEPTQIIVRDGKGSYALLMPNYGASSSSPALPVSVTNTAPMLGQSNLPIQPASVSPTRGSTPRPRSLADVVMPRSFVKDGSLIGFQLFPGELRRVFNTSGLRPGDLLTAIGSRPVSSADESLEWLAKPLDKDGVLLQVQRNGQSVNVRCCALEKT